MTTVCPVPAAATTPAFRAALDRELLQELVRDRLGDGAAPVRLQPDYVRWKDHHGSIVGWHALVGSDGAASYVTVRTAPQDRLADEARKLEHRADEETDVWARSLALLPDHELLLVGFPLDRQMPDLRRLVRASKVRSVVLGWRKDLVPETLRISKSRSRRQIVRYKPERRAVLRWDLGFKGGDASVADIDRTIWFRLLAEPLPARTQLAAAAADAGVRVPELLSAPHDCLLLEGHVAGAPWQPFDAGPLDAVAATLARLHAAVLPAGAPQRDTMVELDLAQRAAADLERLSPDHGRLAGEVAATLARCTPAAGAPPRLLHGDFHCGQVLLADDPGLCDFDRACAGPVGADLAAFFAHAVYDDPQRGPAFAAAMAAAYGRRAPLPPAAELAWWNAGELLRMAAAPFRNLRGDWPAASTTLLEHARRQATEAAR
jgi:aminoglycoside phosphotransferase (APT) family kinase protein